MRSAFAKPRENHLVAYKKGAKVNASRFTIAHGSFKSNGRLEIIPITKSHTKAVAAIASKIRPPAL